MAEYDSGHHSLNQISKETALQAINTIIQLHFEKTLEKKKAVDLQKKELWKLFHLFFLFLALVFAAQVQSPRLQCRHCWIPIGLLSLAHLIFYVSVAQTLRCINGFRYQFYTYTEKHYSYTRFHIIFYISLAQILRCINGFRYQFYTYTEKHYSYTRFHIIFYISLAQILRCINGFRYQRRCHKLTLGLATERLRQMRVRMSGGGGEDGVQFGGDDFEIHYQEPPESYFGKFKRNWALHFAFLILIYGFMVSSSVVLLCF